MSAVPSPAPTQRGRVRSSKLQGGVLFLDEVAEMSPPV
jgi:transcriptional regulator with AAA-type ATPase domain